MPELFLELFSEEIPARMQARAADDLVRLVGEALAPLSPADVRGFFGPRRIALVANVAAGVAETRGSERGPRRTAPEQALAGFLRKHGATQADLREEGDFWVLEKVSPGIDAATLIARELPGVLRRFPWPKSMRWGGTSAFTWVRPLRRVLCILDGATVPFDLREGADDGHGLASSNITEGHRFLAPEPFAVGSAAEWQVGLRERRVIADAAERRAIIDAGLRDLAGRHALTVVEDAGLLDEVAGLVEWPVVLLGRIDAAYMDLPAEVMQVSMRVNQRYFALRDAAGNAAPYFAFVANIAANDGGKAIVSGNERVLRARFADARHFWDLDRKQTLESRVPALDKVVFHAKLGSQGDRVRRLERLAGVIAPMVGADPALAQRAARLAKADLVTGMVGEFPELQGVMGRYYALHDGEDASVADAIRDHYAPKGPTDDVPTAAVSVAVALADKIDLIGAFFAVAEKPTGSGDPYALRRAALGIIRIMRERTLRLPLKSVFCEAIRRLAEGAASSNFRLLDRIDADYEDRGFLTNEEVSLLLATPVSLIFRREFWGVDVGRDFYYPGADGDEERSEDIDTAISLCPESWGFKETGANDLFELRIDQLRGIAEGLSLGKSQLNELTSEADRRDTWLAYIDAVLRLVDTNQTWSISGAIDFIVERLRVQLRSEGARHDVLAAVLGLGVDDDLVRLLGRTDAVTDLLISEDGKNLLAAYRRATNILRIEEKKDGPHNGYLDPALLEAPEEVALVARMDVVEMEAALLMAEEKFASAMETLASLRPNLDAFFENVTVNDPRPDIRRNRLRLLSRVRDAMHLAADFSKIEG